MPPARKKDLVVRLTITLKHSNPKVTRRMDVPAEVSPADLRTYINIAMGWHGGHLWSFHLSRHGAREDWPETDWESEMYDFEDSGAGKQDDSRTLLDVIDFLDGKKTFEYLYDFGDSWEHTIRIGAVSEARADRTYPYLLSGSGRCPLEDIGGIPGYEEFLAALADPEYESEYRDYYPEYFEEGAEFDPEDAELESKIYRLEQMKSRAKQRRAPRGGRAWRRVR